MKEISVYSLDNEILKELVQWDKDVYICIKEPAITQDDPVHFFNKNNTDALVVESTYEGGILKAKIPNVLLTEAHIICGYVYVTKNGESKSIFGFHIPVFARPCPSDYVYPGTDDYVSVTQVLKECQDFAAKASESMTKAKSSEDNAKASEDNSKKSETNAKTSEDLTKQYYDEVKEIRDSIDEEVILAAQREIQEKYIPQIQEYVAESGESRDSAAQSAADSQEYSSTSQHYYELTRKLSIANVGDITFSLDAERNCMVATFMDDSGEEDTHDWYTRFLEFLEEYAANVKAQLSSAQEQAASAKNSATNAAKSLTDAQAVKTSCDKVLSDTQGVKSAAEESCRSILEETSAVKDTVSDLEASARTLSTKAAEANAEANAAADLAEEYMRRTKQLSVSNMGELTFAVDPERDCLVVIYTDEALVTNIVNPVVSSDGNIIQITKGLK